MFTRSTNNPSINQSFSHKLNSLRSKRKKKKKKKKEKLFQKIAKFDRNFTFLPRMLSYRKSRKCKIYNDTMVNGIYSNKQTVWWDLFSRSPIRYSGRAGYFIRGSFGQNRRINSIKRFQSRATVAKKESGRTNDHLNDRRKYTDLSRVGKGKGKGKEEGRGAEKSVDCLRELCLR